MERLRLIMKEVMQEATGSPRPHYREGEARTSLEKDCSDIGKMLVAQKSRLLQMATPRLHTLRPENLIFDHGMIETIVETLQAQIDVLINTVPAQTLSHIREFMEPATIAVSTLLYCHIGEKGYGVKPEDLESTRDSVSNGAQMLSEFPQNISANIRDTLFLYGSTAFRNGDLSDETCEVLRESFRLGMQNSNFVADLRNERYCPAKDVVHPFAGVVFDMFIEGYADVHKKLASSNGTIHQPLIEVLRLASLPRIRALRALQEI